MNRLTVQCEIKLNAEDENYYQVDFLIDGRNLIDRVREFEVRQATAGGSPNLAGSYFCNYHECYTEDFLLGRKGAEYGENGEKTEIIGCECQCSGCWPLATKITLKDELVIWDDFEQPHRRHWSYKGFGPFTFELEQYLQEIRKINTRRLSR